MSMPDINLSGEINITREEALSLILASIGMEELGLAHILNAEGEKIQAAVGTLKPNQPALATNTDQLIAVNKSVEKTMRAVIKNQMLLQFKLEDVLEQLPKIDIFSNIATVEGFYNEIAVTDTDIAYYTTNANLVNKSNEM